MVLAAPAHQATASGPRGRHWQGWPPRRCPVRAAGRAEAARGRQRRPGCVGRTGSWARASCCGARYDA